MCPSNYRQSLHTHAQKYLRKKNLKFSYNGTADMVNIFRITKEKSVAPHKPRFPQRIQCRAKCACTLNFKCL